LTPHPAWQIREGTHAHVADRGAGIDESEGRTPGKEPEEGTGELPDEPTAPEGEEPTEVATPSEEAATEARDAAEGETLPVTPTAPGEAGAPPSQPPQSTVTMSQLPRRGGSRWIWWFVVVVVLILLAVAAAWFLFLRSTEEPTPAPSPSPSPVVWAGAWSRMDGTGGGVLVSGGVDAYEVTLYDGALQPGATVPATLSADGRELRFTLPSQFTFGGGPAGPFEATLTLGSDPDIATLRLTGADQTSISMPLRRVAELVPTGPSASPSTSASPSPAASPTGL